jgi:hypothetical protein
MGCNRHSDNEKFCNDLNGPKTPKMSERPLKTLQYFETSKLNTRVRFPSPAPSSFSDLAGTLDLVPTTAKSPSRLQAEYLSNFACVFIAASRDFAVACRHQFCTAISAARSLSFAQSPSIAAD